MDKLFFSKSYYDYNLKELQDISKYENLPSHLTKKELYDNLEKKFYRLNRNTINTHSNRIKRKISFFGDDMEIDIKMTNSMNKRPKKHIKKFNYPDNVFKPHYSDVELRNNSINMIIDIGKKLNFSDIEEVAKKIEKEIYFKNIQEHTDTYKPLKTKFKQEYYNDIKRVYHILANTQALKYIKNETITMEDIVEPNKRIVEKLYDAMIR